MYISIYDSMCVYMYILILPDQRLLLSVACLGGTACLTLLV